MADYALSCRNCGATYTGDAGELPRTKGKASVDDLPSVGNWARHLHPECWMFFSHDIYNVSGEVPHKVVHRCSEKVLGLAFPCAILLPEEESD